MGTVSETLTGARAKLYINGRLSGVFSSCSWDVAYGVTPEYILGRYDAGELTYTDMSPVSMTVSGFRHLNNGPYVIGSVPKLQDLLRHESISITIVDRRSNQEILTVTGVRPTGHSGSTSARGLFDLSISLMGLTFSDESGPQADIGAVEFG